MKRLIIIKTLIIISILLSASGYAGTLSKILSDKTKNANQSEKIEVVIRVRHAAGPFELKKELSNRFKTIAESHRIGIGRLKSESLRTQKGLLSTLKGLEAKGLANNTRGHWLINVITAEIDVSELETLTNHPDIISIETLPKIELIKPEESVITESKSSFLPTEGIPSNLEVIGAPQAWAEGLTGQGSIICSFDTGVDGLHPALLDTWKGHDGDSSAAWYDPFGGESFPHAFPEAGDFFVMHGTHTMGIMVGHDDTNGDTIGVAPDAKWISAAVIQLPYISIIDAFEWAADPDGDPNTFDDVPDVINHSWGTPNEIVGCGDYLWELIDNTEALGIVNIFSAGNSGSLEQTIANPANRAIDSLDCFAIGNFNHTTTFDNKIISSSSRGPSDCNGVSIKPNVVAPGLAITSSIPDGDYKSMTGTSMAAPHVSGAVAILRQYAPNATPAEIKEALLASCTPYPEGGTSPNNDYGWGLINIPLAIDYLTPTFASDLRISYFEGSLTNPGETATGDLAITNLGQIVYNVSGNVTGWDDGLSVLTTSINFGDVDSGLVVIGDIPFQVVVDDTVSNDRILSIEMTLSGDEEYTKNLKIFIRVGERDGPGKAGFFTHETGAVAFTITDFGQYGFGPNSFLPLDEAGFSFNGSNNHLFEASFLVGVDADHISDGARNFAEDPDNDFAVKAGGELTVSIPGQKADQETVSTFNDSFAENELGLEIQQKTYSWNTVPDNNFVILEYSIKNNSDTTINNLYAGLFFDWDIISYLNCGGYSPDENLGYMYLLNGYNVDSDYRGLTVLNAEGVASFRLRDNTVATYLTWTESNKFAALSEGLVDIINTSKINLSEILSTGPFDLGSGQSDTAVFAVVTANNLDSLKLAAIEAETKYNMATDIPNSESNQIPGDFYLLQNFPNPFNPSTTISFRLHKSENTNLSVYNILGKKVAELIKEKLSAGFHTVEWNGVDLNNNVVASGIYFYRLSVEGNSLTRKMILLK